MPSPSASARAIEALRDACRRLALALALDGGVLPVQGPPGSGKTHLGARMITDLVAAGKKVGVTAVSHKVIRKLLEDTLEAAREEKVRLACVHTCNGTESEAPPRGITEVGDDAVLLGSVGKGVVCGGTVWAWAREEFGPRDADRSERKAGRHISGQGPPTEPTADPPALGAPAIWSVTTVGYGLGEIGSAGCCRFMLSGTSLSRLCRRLSASWCSSMLGVHRYMPSSGRALLGFLHMQSRRPQSST
jgi:hypothetical protein